MRNNLRNQSTREGSCRIERVTGQRHFTCLRKADDARQKPRPAIAGNQSQLHEALGKHGSLTGYANIAHAGEVTTGANGRPIDSRDHRHLQSFEQQGQALDTRPIVTTRIHRLRVIQSAAGLHLIDIAAARESAAFSSQDHDACADIPVRLADQLDQAVNDGGARNGVAHFRLVEPDRDDRTVLAVQDTVAHVHSPDLGSSLLSVNREAPARADADRNTGAVIANWRSNISLAVQSWLSFRTRLQTSIANGSLAAILAASARAAPSASPRGTTRLTSPCAARKADETISAVMMSSAAIFGGSWRGNLTRPPALGTRPRLVSLRPNRASSAA